MALIHAVEVQSTHLILFLVMTLLKLIELCSLCGCEAEDWAGAQQLLNERSVGERGRWGVQTFRTSAVVGRMVPSGCLRVWSMRVRPEDFDVNALGP